MDRSFVLTNDITPSKECGKNCSLHLAPSLAILPVVREFRNIMSCLERDAVSSPRVLAFLVLSLALLLWFEIVGEDEISTVVRDSEILVASEFFFFRNKNFLKLA